MNSQFLYPKQNETKYFVHSYLSVVLSLPCPSSEVKPITRIEREGGGGGGKPQKGVLVYV